LYRVEGAEVNVSKFSGPSSQFSVGTE